MGDHKDGFANAELMRRFKNLVLDGRIAAIDTDKKLVDVTVFTSTNDDFTAKGLPLMNVLIDSVSVGNPVVLINAQGAIETGLVYVLGPDPEQQAQNERMNSLQQQIYQLSQRTDSLNYNNN